MYANLAQLHDDVGEANLVRRKRHEDVASPEVIVQNHALKDLDSQQWASDVFRVLEEDSASGKFQKFNIIYCQIDR